MKIPYLPDSEIGVAAFLRMRHRFLCQGTSRTTPLHLGMPALFPFELGLN